MSDYFFDIGTHGQPNRVTPELIVKLDKEDRLMILGGDWDFIIDDISEMLHEEIEIVLKHEATDGTCDVYESRYAAHPYGAKLTYADRVRDIVNIVNELIEEYRSEIRHSIKNPSQEKKSGFFLSEKPYSFMV